jgi:hypothetical protein
MDAILENVGRCVCQFADHKVIVAPWSLVRPVLKKWSRNRDADMSRVQEMRQYIDAGGFIAPFLHVADLMDEGLVCYDGNHRREAFSLCVLTEDFSVVLDVLCHATQDKVFHAFDVVNKAVQVPAMFVEEDESHLKQDILEVVRRFEQTYKSFCSTSSRCHAPQFNRDAFMDSLYNIYKEFQGRYTVKEIEAGLVRLNELYSTGKIPTGKVRPAIVKKCKEQGLWIFKERTINMVDLTRAMTTTASKGTPWFGFNLGYMQ